MRENNQHIKGEYHLKSILKDQDVIKINQYLKVGNLFGVSSVIRQFQV